MKKHLIGKNPVLYKANMHTHTNISDGRFSPEEVKERYVAQGYSIVAFTDHDYCVAHPELRDAHFLPITSYELSIHPDGTVAPTDKLCHLNLYARDPENTTQVAFDPSRRFSQKYADSIKYHGKAARIGYNVSDINYAISEARRHGFIVCYNHPSWSNETILDFAQYSGFFAMEVYNHGCAVSNSTSDEWNIQDYDTLLRAGRRVLPFFTDDSHNPDIDNPRNDGFGGYLMVDAPRLEYGCVMDAIEKGDFYASMGPEIKELTVEDGVMCIRCSPVREIKFLTAGRKGKWVYEGEDKPVTEGRYEIPEGARFVRVELIDGRGRYAVTRGYFEDELV